MTVSAEDLQWFSERYREVVLSGVNLGRWGREPGMRLRLADLIERILRETEIERLRAVVTELSAENLQLKKGLWP